MPGSPYKAKMTILDEDCDRPACEDIQKALPKTMEEMKAMSKKQAANYFLYKAGLAHQVLLLYSVVNIQVAR